MSSAEAPSAPRCAAHATTEPSPDVTDRLSMTRTSAVPSKAFAAVCADCIVADSWAERLMQTTASAPASRHRRKAASKAPGDGAAVSGRSEALAIRR
jgi:hypothetical protein